MGGLTVPRQTPRGLFSPSNQIILLSSNGMLPRYERYFAFTDSQLQAAAPSKSTLAFGGLHGESTCSQVSYIGPIVSDHMARVPCVF